MHHLQVVVKGGPNSIKTVSESLDSGVPVVLVKGSGGTADLLSDLWEKMYADDDAANENTPSRDTMVRRQVSKYFLKEYGSLYEAFIKIDQKRCVFVRAHGSLCIEMLLQVFCEIIALCTILSLRQTRAYACMCVCEY